MEKVKLLIKKDWKTILLTLSLVLNTIAMGFIINQFRTFEVEINGIGQFGGQISIDENEDYYAYISWLNQNNTNYGTADIVFIGKPKQTLNKETGEEVIRFRVPIKWKNLYEDNRVDFNLQRATK